MDMKDAKFWGRQLELADREEDKYRKRAKKIIERYRDESKDGPSKFNVLWSNTQTQLPAMYSSRPKPDVRRRWRTENKVGRDIATAVERALDFSMDNYDFDRFGEKVALDLLLPGRAVGRVRYHPFFKSKTIEEVFPPGMEHPEEAVEQEDGSFLFEKQFDELFYEEVRAYHVPWDKYRQSPADCWDDVWWVAYGDNFLTKEEIVETFGEEFDDVPLKFTDDEEDKHEEGQIKKAQVWEIWNREDKQVVAYVKGYDKLLLEEDDPLHLKNFFPQPEPVLLIETTDSMIPIPEYTMYQYQAEELNEVSERIARLTQSMKAVGFYPGSEAKKMNELLKSDENILVPVDDWAAYAEKGGLKGMIDWYPIKDIADVWQRLIVQREQILQAIYELVGISDIQRGSTDPRETRGAQQLKANFGSRRLLPKQQRIQRFLRDILKIKAEIIAEHFDVNTLSQMTATQVTPEMRAIMRSDALRTFTIDIETDSTVAPDEERDKQGVAEFLAAQSQYLQQVAPIIQAQPAAVKPLGKILLWMSRKFKIAREVEDEIEEFINSFQQQQNQGDEAAKAEAEAKKRELEMEQQEAQAEMQRKQAATAAEIQRKDKEAEADIRRKDREVEAKIRRENRLAGVEERIEERRDEREAQKDSEIRLIRDENGKICGAECNGKKLKLVRDEKGRPQGARSA